MTKFLRLCHRAISFDPNTITIVTEIAGGKEIEVLTVQEVDYRNGYLSISVQPGTIENFSLTSSGTSRDN